MEQVSVRTLELDNSVEYVEPAVEVSAEEPS